MTGEEWIKNYRAIREMKCPNCTVLLTQMKKDKEKIKELESERECLSKWLIEARMEIVELEEVG